MGPKHVHVTHTKFNLLPNLPNAHFAFSIATEKEFLPVQKLNEQLSSCSIPEVRLLLESHPACSKPERHNPTKKQYYTKNLQENCNIQFDK